MSRTLSVHAESWPLAQTFTISRGSKDAADVVRVELVEGSVRGQGECVPYARYGESVEGVVAVIEGLRDPLCAGMGRAELASALPAGAARNAVDCALWDLEAKRSGRPVWELAGLPRPEPVTTAYTLSLGSVEQTAAEAEKNAHRTLLKLKLGGGDVPETLAAVRRAAPGVRLIIDANEAWTVAQLLEWAPALARAQVELIEQPLPAGKDAELEGLRCGVPLGADESCHTSETIDQLARSYDVVNITLDKTGGLTEAIAMHRAARAAKLEIMVGCMVATSLAMAPATLLTAGARFVDLDGPLLLARDRPGGLEFVDDRLQPPVADFWG